MIKSIEIKGFRGIKEGKLEDLTPLVVLVGPNGCGKSTVLDAALVSTSPRPGRAITFLATERVRPRGSSRWLLWQGENRSVASIDVRTDVKNGLRSLEIESVQVGGEEQFSIQFSIRNPTAVITLGEKVNIGSISDSGSSDSNTAHPLSGISEVHLLDGSGSIKQAQLHDIYSQAVVLGRRKEVRDLIGDVVPGLSDLTLLTDRDTPVVYLEFADHAIPIAIAGDGIQTLCRICLELASRPDGLVLLEEPEVHQHPGAIRQSARAIWAAVRRDIQVILSTHSLELIDRLLSESKDDEELKSLSIYRMQLSDGCLRTSHLDGPGAALLRSSIEEDLR